LSTKKLVPIVQDFCQRETRPGALCALNRKKWDRTTLSYLPRIADGLVFKAIYFHEVQAGGHATNLTNYVRYAHSPQMGNGARD
jgi:hypothetical protein